MRYIKTGITFPTSSLRECSSKHIVEYVEKNLSRNWSSESETTLPYPLLMQKGVLEELETVFSKSRGIKRTLTSIKASRDGSDDTKIPNLAASVLPLAMFLMRDEIDRWIYKRGNDGFLDAYLVTDVRYCDPDYEDSPPYVSISYVVGNPVGGSRGRNTSEGVSSGTICLSSGHVLHKTPAEVIFNSGFLKETPELRAEYDRDLERYQRELSDGHKQQYIDAEGRKYVMATKPSDVVVPSNTYPSSLKRLTGEDDESGHVEELRPLPLSMNMDVFSLTSGTTFSSDSRRFTRYEYDDTLLDRIVLPSDQRELLDVLTTDTDMFTGDMIEGKSSGNLIFTKGRPGLGKTLTAEVYSETIHRPLYKVHSGRLGTTPNDVRHGLEAAFKACKELDLVLLIDEADVFVLERGRDVVQNAIVAEFLQVLEYFDGLMFMTTNRGDSIDDAILSRCAAIIDYRAPQDDDAIRAWRTVAQINKVELSDELVSQLVEGFHDIAPRDMKMLLRLSLKMAAHRGVPLDIGIIARASVFRGLHYVGSFDVSAEKEEKRSQESVKKSKPTEETVSKRIQTKIVKAMESEGERFVALDDEETELMFGECDDYEIVNENARGTSYVKATGKHLDCSHGHAEEKQIVSQQTYFEIEDTKGKPFWLVFHKCLHDDMVFAVCYPQE